MMKWDEILRIDMFRPEKPHMAIVELVDFLKARKVRRILDLGCGTGGNLIYLAKLGFQVHGTDISKTGLMETKRRLKKEGLAAELTKSDMKSIPCSHSSFDAVISVNVIYHDTLEGMQKTISEIHIILKHNGLAFIPLQSRHSHKFAKGKEIEKGVLHHFSDKNEVMKLLKIFDILNLKLDEFVDEKGRLHSHWKVLVEKFQPKT
jgi:cyclopropane fatty-acyl-phospholipid synthase-like methyltransferase